MTSAKTHWELLVLDAAPAADTLSSLCAVDIDGDGHQEVLTAGEGGLLWYRPDTFERGVIDEGQYGVGLIAADLGGDGELEVIAGEHDPFWPYRNRSRLYVYKKADRNAMAFYRATLDERFEHHCGAKRIDLGAGRSGIMSHGWNDSIYVNLWIGETFE